MATVEAEVTFWGLVQILMDLVLLSGVITLWIRLTRPPQDDPRLSKGLQLLQSKISVLEDLSDRTENQVSQLTAVLERKCKELQEKINEAEKQVTRIETSAQKSLEVASIFQDRIPHSEIIERQNTVKYVTAARMAHRGSTIEEILNKVDLSRAEVEFIARVNRDQLQFSEEGLPEWAREGVTADPAESPSFSLSYHLQKQNFSTEEQTQTSQRPTPGHAATPEPHATTTASGVTPAAQSFVEIQLGAPAEPKRILAQTSSGKTVEVKPFEFPRIQR